MADDDHTEEWRQIPGRANAYSASSLGRIRRDRPGPGARAGHILRQFYTRKYATTTLSIDGANITSNVHRLVAAAFLGPCPAGHEVDHVNGRRMDNRARNLRYVTRSENQLAAAQLGLIRRKLTAPDVVRIRSEVAAGASLASVAARYRIASSTVGKIARRELWRSV